MMRRDEQGWSKAETTLHDRCLKAKYLAGSHSDRQTGAIHTHRWRVESGASIPARRDQAKVTTKDWEGASRLSQYESNDKALLDRFMPISRKLLNGTYKPAPMVMALIPKEDGTGRNREVYIQTAYDRTVGAVIAETIEPVIEGLLHPNQHGYRSKRFGEVSGLAGIPQGSTKVVAHRVYRRVQSGWLWCAEIDICNAFPSISLERVKKALMRSGCRDNLTKLIVGSMSGKIKDRSGQPQPVSGIPAGHPLAGLMFNLVVRHLHAEQASKSESVAYADNYYIAALTERQLNKEINRFSHALQNLNLKGEVKQRLRLGGEQTMTILKEWEIKSLDGKGFNLTPTKRRKRHRKPLCRYREMR